VVTDGVIQLTIPICRRAFALRAELSRVSIWNTDNARTINRRGVLLLTAESGCNSAGERSAGWGEATLADGTVAAAPGARAGIAVDVAGATDQGVVDRQRPVTAPWLDLELPDGAGGTGGGHPRSCGRPRSSRWRRARATNTSTTGSCEGAERRRKMWE